MISRSDRSWDHKPSGIFSDANAVLDAFRSSKRALDASRYQGMASQGPPPVLIHALPAFHPPSAHLPSSSFSASACHLCRTQHSPSATVYTVSEFATLQTRLRQRVHDLGNLRLDNHRETIECPLPAHRLPCHPTLGLKRVQNKYDLSNMLLPSAISCDSITVQPKPRRPSRPKLLSFETYDPRHRSQSPVVGLIASCRALQNMLGERFGSPSPALEATIRAKPMGSPFGASTPPPTCPPAARGANKRRREDFEDDEDITPVEQESPQSYEDMYSTPKRRRTVPFDLPPGLMPSDFEALADTSSSQREVRRRRNEPRDIDMPSIEETRSKPSSLSQDMRYSWSENDDRLLVETVLSKLNLSSREWNDCAVQLGKDKDSLGRRWRLLLGEGNVGLRRGSRRQERVDLDIQSW